MKIIDAEMAFELGKQAIEHFAKLEENDALAELSAEFAQHTMKIVLDTTPALSTMQSYSLCDYCMYQGHCSVEALGRDCRGAGFVGKEVVIVEEKK